MIRLMSNGFRRGAGTGAVKICDLNSKGGTAKMPALVVCGIRDRDVDSGLLSEKTRCVRPRRNVHVGYFAERTFSEHVEIESRQVLPIISRNR